jgi:hypothetical protein
MLLRVPTMVCGLLLVAAVEPAGAQDSLSLPAPILTAFRQAYPHATILSASRERRDGKVVYEVESLDGSLRRDLLYDLDGKAIEIEEILPVDSLPEAVRTAVARDVPNGEVVGAERVMRGVVTLYEVQVRHKGRTEFLTYDPTGQRHE